MPDQVQALETGATQASPFHAVTLKRMPLSVGRPVCRDSGFLLDGSSHLWITMVLRDLAAGAAPEFRAEEGRIGSTSSQPCFLEAHRWSASNASLCSLHLFLPRPRFSPPSSPNQFPSQVRGKPFTASSIRRPRLAATPPLWSFMSGGA